MAKKTFIQALLDFLRDIGMLRSGAVVAKGDAKEMQKLVNPNDIPDTRKNNESADEKDIVNKKEGLGKNNDKKSSHPPIVRWIVVVVAAFFFLALWGSGITFWSLLGIAMWGYFVYWLWKGAGVTAATGKVIGLAIGAVLISFVLADLSQPEAGIVTTTSDSDVAIMDADEMTPMEKYSRERLVAFIENIGEVMDEDMTSVEPAPGTLWTAQNVSLQLTDAHSATLTEVSAKDLDQLQRLFVKDFGATTGGIGFEFVPPVNTTSAGFVINNPQFTELMCVLSLVEESHVQVSCGYGPGGQAHLPQGRM
jgi:hypothetical protein